MKMNDMEVTRQAAELFSKTFEVIDEERFYYKHFVNPERLAEPVRYYTRGEKICAMNAFDQVTLLVQGNELRAIQSSDSAVDAEYRGQGLFFKLQIGMMESYAKEGGKIFFGIPNEKSFPIFMKLGWNHVGNFISYRRMESVSGCIRSLLRKRDKVSFSKTELCEYRGHQILVGKDMNIIRENDISAINGEINIGIKRSFEYYKWKVFGHRGIDYEIVKITCGDKLEALFLLTRKQGNHFVFANVAEWYISRRVAENEIMIFAKVLHKFLKKWCDFSTLEFINPENGEVKVAEKLGYMKRNKVEYKLIAKGLDEDAGKNVKQMRLWKLRGIDPDTALN